jgi:hypothetical protein
MVSRCREVGEQAMAIPTMLYDSPTARLDRPAQVKAVAQLGATIGRTFAHEVLRTASMRDETMLQQAGMSLARQDGGRHRTP